MTALAVTGCGGSSSTPRSSTVASTNTTPATTPTTPAPKPIKNPFKQPQATPHPGAKVDQLIVKDVAKGSGLELHAGDMAIVDYIAANYVTGAMIDTTWGNKPPAELPIDQGSVIDGWWQGMPGMRVGGRRILIIPPSLGFVHYKNRAVRDATAYFVVDLLGVIPAKPKGTGLAQ